MKKTIVVYQSKYGFCEKYAVWLSQALSCDLTKKKEVNVNKLKEYDVIIFIGGLYAGGVSGIDLLVKNYSEISDKHVILIPCGVSDMNNPKNTDAIRANVKNQITPEMSDKVSVFTLRSGIDYKKLSLLHKMMMSMMNKMLTKKAPEIRTEKEQSFIETYGKTVDYTDESAIVPIVSYVASL